MTEMLAPLNSLFVRMLAAMEPEERVGILKCFCAQCGTCLARFDKEGKVQGNPTGPLAFLDNLQGIGKNLCPNLGPRPPMKLSPPENLNDPSRP